MGIHMEVTNKLNPLNRAKYTNDSGKPVCPFCKATIDPEAFKDALSLKEWKISGLCQSCQDEIFG